MSINRPDSKLELWNEGASISVVFERTSSTTARISWNLPNNINVYDGGVLVLSTKELSIDNVPVDGTRYNGSLDLSNPNDLIGSAYVLIGLYGDKITNEVNVINLDPNEIYYAGFFACTNTLEYYSNGSFSYVTETKLDNVPGDIVSSDVPPLNPTIGQIYYNSSTGIVNMFNGSVWIKANSRDVLSGEEYPIDVQAGDFFYHTVTKKLYAYDGTNWTAVQTENNGIPSYDRIKVGTDGSFDEYEALIRQIKGKLGYPAVCVELDDSHFYNAVENAIQEFRRRADNAYKREFFFMKLIPDQDVYFLNHPGKTDRVVDVIDIHRMNSLSMVTFGENGIYAQQFLTQFYSPGMIDTVSIHLIHQLAENINNIFAGDITFNWNEYTRELKLHRRIFSEEKVLLETSTERTKQELINDRYAHPWIEDWAKAECLYALGMIRSKFGTLPGAGGGLTLNGAELLAQANSDFEELRRQITDMEVGNGGDEFGNYSCIIG